MTNVKDRYEFIEEMFEKLGRISVEQIVGRYTKLIPRGRHWMGLCPFHRDTKLGSFIVTPDKMCIRDSRTIHNTPTGIARKLSCLRSFFDYYTGIGEMKRNPAARISTPKIHTKEIIQLDPDEVEILLSGIENGSDKISKHQKKYLDKTRLRDLAITTLLLGTGIRISECVGLDIQDVNFKDNSIKITRKGGNEQIVFFNNEVQYVLEDYLHEQRLNLIPEKGSEDALFLSLKNNRISVDAIEKMIVKYARMYVPHKRITPHKLRSTFGTQLYQETGDLYLVAETLGHSSVDTSKKYASMKERKRLVAQTIQLRAQNRES